MEFIRALKSHSRMLLYKKIMVAVTSLIIVMFMGFISWFISQQVSIHEDEPYLGKDMQALEQAYAEAEQSYKYATGEEKLPSGGMLMYGPEYYQDQMEYLEFLMSTDYGDVKYIDFEKVETPNLVVFSQDFTPKSSGGAVMMSLGWFNIIIVALFSLSITMLYLITSNIGGEKKHYHAAPVSSLNLNLARITISTVISVIFWIAVVCWGFIAAAVSKPVYVLFKIGGVYSATPLGIIFMQKMAMSLPIIFAISLLAVLVVLTVDAIRK